MIEEQLATLALLFSFAVVGGVLASRFKQPLVLGLLIVGSIIGPHGLHLVTNHEAVDLIIEFGAILLLFVVGIEFSVKKLIDLGPNVLIAGVFKIALVFFIGFIGSLLLGLDMMLSTFIALILSFASTVVVVKILEQKALIQRKEVPFILAILIIEDVVAVLVITLLSGAQVAGSSIIGTVEQLIVSMAILVAVYLLVSRFADRLFRILSKHSHEEMMMFIGLALCAGFAYFASMLGLSPTIGAFLAGSTISSMRESKRLGETVLPYNVMFSSLFFIGIGILVDFKVVFEHIWLILGLLALFVVASLIAVGFSTFLFANMRKEQPIFSGIAMLSVGEFSILVAKEAGAFGITIDLVSVTTSLILLSSVAMVVLIRHSERIYELLSFKSALGNNMQALGNYVNSFLRHIEVQSTHTNALRKYMFSSMGSLILLGIAIIGSHKLYAALGLSGIYTYGFITLAGLVCVVLIYKLVMHCKQAYRMGVVITSHIDQHMNHSRAEKVLSNVLLGLAIILMGLVSPVIVLMLGLPAIFVLVPIGIVLLGAFVVFRISSMLRYYGPRY